MNRSATLSVCAAITLGSLNLTAAAQPCDGWAELGPRPTSFISASVLDVTSHDDGSGSGPELYAVGSFTTYEWPPLATANRVAKWNGTNWVPLTDGGGNGLNGRAWAVASFNGDLYVAGDFTTAGGVPANRIARWDGSSWSAVGAGIPALQPPEFDTIRTLSVYQGSLYAGGSFGNVGGISQHGRVARWNGTDWVPVLGPVSGIGGGSVNDMVVYNGELIVTGGFNAADGQFANGDITRWNGVSWQPLGSGSSLSGQALAVHEGSLYVGGNIVNVGGSAVTSNVARWDGSSWAGLPGETDGDVLALASYDDGTGPALYVGGLFNQAGGVAASNFARWDGSSWSALNGGVNAQLYAFATVGDELYAGGNFREASGVQTGRVVRWGCTAAPQPCIADLTGDGVADLDDADAFIVAFIGRDPIADLAMPFGIFDLEDINAFIASYLAGCP